MVDRNFITGKCMQMCPLEEMIQREKAHLLHRLEIIPGTQMNPKMDKKRMIKCFSRSAAGKESDPYTIRPIKVLLETVSYLLLDVVNVSYVPWHVVYDFISDRLRAVRQDMVVQNLSAVECISILQPMVRFYVYSSYRLCDEDIKHFDPVLNHIQLQECLKRLLRCYTEIDTNKKGGNDNFLDKTRPTIEALYLLYNLDNEEALWHTLTLPNRWRRDLVVRKAFEIAVNFTLGNFVCACKLIKKLPPVLALTASLRLPVVRKRAFQVMSVAYHSKNCSNFPIDHLQDTLLYSSKQDLEKDLAYYGINYSNIFVYFTKNMIDKKTVRPRKEHFVADKLAELDLQTLLVFVE